MSKPIKCPSCKKVFFDIDEPKCPFCGKDLDNQIMSMFDQIFGKESNEH